MYYNIDKLCGFTLKRIPDVASERKTAIRKFLCAQNLIDLGILKKIYTHNLALHIDENSFSDYINALYSNFKLKKNIPFYSKCYVESYDELFIVENIEQFRDLENQRKCVDIIHAKKRRHQKACLNKPLPTDIAHKKIMAVDFEFSSRGDVVEPIEMGISIQHNGIRTSFNYSFTQINNKFNYGDTVVVDKSLILDIFKSHFVDVDYLVGHNLSMELNILINSGLDENFFDNVNMIDTSYVSKNEFHFLNTDHSLDQTASLRTSLRTFNLPHINLHVAGNDASYTLDVLENLVLQKLKYAETNGITKIKVKNMFQREAKI